MASWAVCHPHTPLACCSFSVPSSFSTRTPALRSSGGSCVCSGSWATQAVLAHLRNPCAAVLEANLTPPFISVALDLLGERVSPAFCLVLKGVCGLV